MKNPLLKNKNKIFIYQKIKLYIYILLKIYKKKMIY